MVESTTGRVHSLITNGTKEHLKIWGRRTFSPQQRNSTRRHHFIFSLLFLFFVSVCFSAFVFTITSSKSPVPNQNLLTMFRLIVALCVASSTLSCPFLENQAKNGGMTNPEEAMFAGTLALNGMSLASPSTSSSPL